MSVLEERIISVQKSQVNQITLFDFIFIFLNYVIRIATLFIELFQRVIGKSPSGNIIEEPDDIPKRSAVSIMKKKDC